MASGVSNKPNFHTSSDLRSTSSGKNSDLDKRVDQLQDKMQTQRVETQASHKSGGQYPAPAGNGITGFKPPKPTENKYPAPAGNGITGFAPPK